MQSRETALKAFIQAGIFGLVFLFILLLLKGYQVLLLVFAGILFSILLRGMTDWLSDKLKMPDGISLTLAIVIPLLLAALGAWQIAPEVADQSRQLGDQLPQAVEELRRQLLQYPWLEQLWGYREQLASSMPDGSAGAELIARFFTTTFGVVGNLILVFFLGLFLAVTPDWYVKGVVRLFPVHRREHVHGILSTTGMTLRNWLIAKLTTMVIIGVLTTAGLWLLGIELALVLGVIAALLSFIPNFGPIVSAIPAVLIALIDGPQKALYVVLLYVAIQTFESYLITPMLQKKMVELPPALLLTMQVLLGVLAGILGLILSVPLTVAAMIMVRMGYVEGVLEKGTPAAAKT